MIPSVTRAEPRRVRFLTAASVIAGLTALLGACGSDPSDEGDVSDPEVIIATTSAPDPPEPPASTAPETPVATAPTTTETTTASTVVPTPPGDPRVELVEVGRFDQPVGLAVRPGDDRLFVIEQAGRILALDPMSGRSELAADLSDRTVSQGERGLLGLAFETDGSLAWVNYTDLDGDTVIAEYAVSADGIFDPESERVLLRIDQPFGNHNGGHLEIGLDGLLYIGTGDGGSAGDPLRVALDPGDLLGKLLRIDPRPNPEADSAYRIPPENPFLDDPDAAAEVFAIGLRNPWKFSFDPATGDLWIADVGQNAFEEINWVPAPEDGTVAGSGLSFGWSAFEGLERFNNDLADDGHTPPVLTYENGPEGCSISGGAVYRGLAIPELAGGYVYSDYCSGRVWMFDRLGERSVVLATSDAVTAVQPGPDGELYVISHRGPVLRLVDAG